ncbi:MAG: alpha-amylase family glycosyl hydrolase [Acidobacteriaceae bacterium]
MRAIWRVTLLMWVGLVCVAAQGQLQSEKACAAIAEGGAPCVYQVDPPNWWTDMPSPMLLLYGRNLRGARIDVHGKDVRVTRTHFSANGHYAFVWLQEPHGDRPQTLEVEVATGRGRISIPYEMEKRRSSSYGFQGFSPADTMYLIMTDRFADGDLKNDPHPSQLALPRGWHGGDFKGIEDHLNYLKQLGVTAIWITPAYDNEGSPQSYHGYSATNMYKPDPHFGTVRDYKNLIAAIHAHGMKFVLDTVPNHVGAGNPWAKDPPAPDWFHGTLAHHLVAQNNFAALVDPHADWAQQKATVDGWFANVLPDLNQENPLVREYLIQNAIWWIETGGVDGLRIDTFSYVGRAFWQQFNGELHELFPRLTSVGEIFNPDPTIVSYFAGGVAHGGIDTRLWTPFDFPTYFALRLVLTHKKPMSYLEHTWRQDSLYPHPERLVPFFGNHDTVRFMSQPGVTVKDLKLAFGIVLTMRGTPEIYYGDELAMKGGADPDNRHDFPGGFPGDKQDAFTPAGRTLVQNEVHDWVQGLLHFRDSQPVFGDGGQQDIVHNATTLVYLRARDMGRGCTAGETGRVLVAVNDGDKAETLKIDPTDTALSGCSHFVSAAGTHVPAALRGGKVTMTLGPRQMAIYTVR